MKATVFWAMFARKKMCCFHKCSSLVNISHTPCASTGWFGTYPLLCNFYSSANSTTLGVRHIWNISQIILQHVTSLLLALRIRFTKELKLLIEEQVNYPLDKEDSDLKEITVPNYRSKGRM